MLNLQDIPEWGWTALVVITTVLWGGSYIVLKGALDTLSAGWLLAFRFLAAAVVVGIAFRHHLAESLDGSHLVAGALIGITGGLAYLTQNIGLTTTTPGRNAFLTATNCVMVPFVYWAFERRRPGANSFLAAFMALAGVGLVSLTASDAAAGLSQGDWLTLLAALLFAINIVLISRFAAAHDAATLTVVQLAVMGLVCLAWALAFEPAPDPSTFDYRFWLEMAYVVFLSTSFAIVVENFAQQYMDPSRAAVIYSLESLFGVLFSVLIYGERVSLQLALGFVLIFAAVLVSELGGRLVARRREVRQEGLARD